LPFIRQLPHSVYAILHRQSNRDMDDSNNGSLVFSRQNLLHVPSEVFGVAAKRPLRCLDLGYNYLQSNEVAALGDLDERSQLNSRSSRGLVSVGSMRHTPVALKDVNNATIRSAGLHPSTPLSVADSVLGAAVPNSRVSTGSVWYHEEQLLIPKLRHLETLYLSNNALKAIPDELGNLVSLKSLWLDANAITEIPLAVSKLEKLEMLSLSYNQVKTVSPTIGCLSSLLQLLLNSNCLGAAEGVQVLPPQVGLLTALQVLDLADNRLGNLPIELGRLHSTLKRLNLHNNPHRFPPSGIVSQGREATLEKCAHSHRCHRPVPSSAAPPTVTGRLAVLPQVPSSAVRGTARAFPHARARARLHAP